MFYGHTAQWSYLEPDGILPDFKARIHDRAAAYADRYRRTGKLDNNEMVKRTVVPTLKTVIVDERGGTLVDVNRASWRLGLEAVRHHPGAYGRQVLHNLFYLNFIPAQRTVPFEGKQPSASARNAETYESAKGRDDALDARLFALRESRAAIREGGKSGGGLRWYARFTAAIGRMRLLSPVFLTTVLLPLLVWFNRERQRLFWSGNFLLWYSYLVLLSTVGRPLDRYLRPVVPIMCWTISTAAVGAWHRGWARREEARRARWVQSSPSPEALGTGLGAR